MTKEPNRRLSLAFPLKCIGLLFLLLPFSRLNAATAAFRNPYGKFPTNASLGDTMFADYFRAETRNLSERCLPENSLEDWQQEKTKLRQELQEMLGLDPPPPKTDLKATITGTLDHPEFTVEKLHFQSMPGLYVTANLYLPKKLVKPAPAILYLCGHAQVKTNGVSFGCKVAYQHHGIWFARNGFVCLVLDTVQLGELEGLHHGTYREGLWWWNSRGYTAATAEAWNSMRALDYLETRPEVDKERFGVTGRSGGGAYTWWIAALDERVKVACAVAGITDLQNYVVDGAVEGHCDCMFMVNTYRWDYPELAALVAPRPLLICNSDKDTIFPLDGVVRLHEKVRRIYERYGASDKLGLVITEGPHHDSQELQLPVFRWFNRFLKNEAPLVEMAAVPLFTGQQLKVFDKLPNDAINGHCYEHFTRVANDSQALEPAKALADLKRKTFGSWPDTTQTPATRQLASAERDGVRFTAYEFESQPGVRLRFYVLRASVAPQAVQFEVLDEIAWRQRIALLATGFAPALNDEQFLAGAAQAPVSSELTRTLSDWIKPIRDNNTAWVGFAPRGLGMSHISQEKPYFTHVRRRFMLLGQTLASMQVWDLREALQAARQLDGLGTLPLTLDASPSPEMTEVTAFAALFESPIAQVRLAQEPRADREASDFLNWSRIVTPAQFFSLLRQRCANVHLGRQAN